MQAAARTKLNFNAQDHNPAEFDFLEADRGGIAGSYSFAERKNNPPDYAKKLSQFAPRVVTGTSHFPLPNKGRQDFLSRRVGSKYQTQRKKVKEFGWTKTFSERNMVYAVGAWALFLGLYFLRVR